MSDLIRIPLSYRPREHDDWGTIRDADGHPFLNVCWRMLWDDEALNVHRHNRTDPCEAVGRKVVEILNAALAKEGGGH